MVSKLCKIIDEKIMPKEHLVWQKEYMDAAVKKLLKESNTNFDSLIKNIENNKEISRTIDMLLLNGVRIEYNTHNPNINLGMLYGIFKEENGKLKINNRVYEQLIYDYKMSKIQTTWEVSNYGYQENFLKDDGTLDIKKILVKFQEFMKHEKSKKRMDFLEADGRLVFLAFLSPIINGKGFAFKEVQGAEEGYLLVFDFRKENALDEDKVLEQKVMINGKEKRITEVFC